MIRTLYNRVDLDVLERQTAALGQQTQAAWRIAQARQHRGVANVVPAVPLTVSTTATGTWYRLLAENEVPAGLSADALARAEYWAHDVIVSACRSLGWYPHDGDVPKVRWFVPEPDADRARRSGGFCAQAVGKPPLGHYATFDCCTVRLNAQLITAPRHELTRAVSHETRHAIQNPHHGGIFTPAQWNDETVAEADAEQFARAMVTGYRPRFDYGNPPRNDG